MAAGLTGSQPGWQVVRGSAEARASLRVSGFLSLAPLQTKALESSDKHGEGGPTATEVHVCFGLLLITVRQASKTPASAATSSVKFTRAPASCRHAGRVVVLTALWFGCPLVELELREQGAILLVLLHVQTHIAG